MMMPKIFEFSINLSAEKTQHIYQGQARYILVYTDDGLSLQLPAINFRQYVTDRGIQGRFKVEIDDNNKIIRLSLV
jgi:hypothetical protein